MRTPKEQQSPHDLKLPETATAPFNPVIPSDDGGDHGDDQAGKQHPEVKSASPEPRGVNAPATPHTRQGDRGNRDNRSDDGADDTARLLPVYVRLKDLVRANIATSWPQLLRMIAAENFPTGVMLGKNTRAWRLDEVEAWLATRPTARKIVNPRRAKEEAGGRIDAEDGGLRRRRRRPRKEIEPALAKRPRS
jgi:predicted DNA-binding transcriptional regulator AlpA